MILLVDGEEVKTHLARALAEHLKWCRSNGITPPPEMAELLGALVATNGPERPKIADATDPADAEAVTYEGAARRLGCSERTVRRMVSDGRLTAVDAGRRRLVPVEALRALVGSAQ